MLLLKGIDPAMAQESTYGKNAVSFNLTRMATSEINMGIEHFLDSRKSIEIIGSLVYVHDNLAEAAKKYSDTPLFSEHGYAGRAYYKVYKRPDDKSKWRDYIATGLIYKHLYYNEQWFENEKTDDDGTVYHERIYQSRVRDRLGVEFLWGKVYEMNRTFAFEFYYGAGLVVTSVSRTDYLKQPDDREPEIIVLNITDESVYFRPSIQLGIKFRIRS
jgi:hypothetical protein